MSIAHSKKAISIAEEYGWLPGACYTNIRNVRSFNNLGLLDIDWRNYNFKQHLEIAKETRPLFTVAQDVVDINMLEVTLRQAYELLKFATNVIIVPKDLLFEGVLEEIVPKDFIFGYSVPTRYSGTLLPTSDFKRPVHLLGGRPDAQRRLADKMNVVSIDCNRFTLDAAYGYYFHVDRFLKNKEGGYEDCLRKSINNINLLWEDYSVKEVGFDGIARGSAQSLLNENVQRTLL